MERRWRAIAPASRRRRGRGTSPWRGGCSRKECGSGGAFRFESDALEDVARFVANERKCCPFLDFDIAVAAAAGPTWLRITGPAGTRAFLDAELGSG